MPSSSSSSSSSSATTAKAVVATRQWKAVTVTFDRYATNITIFIIHNYENFFRNPRANGIFKGVDRQLMERAWMDRQDLLFIWQRTVYEDGTYMDAPVIGSHKEAFGELKDIIATLRT